MLYLNITLKIRQVIVAYILNDPYKQCNIHTLMILAFCIPAGAISHIIQN